jgi:replicative DNA helicase
VTTIANQKEQHSFTAERSVIGSIVLENTSYDKISHVLMPHDFFSLPHQLLYSHIQRLAEEGTPFDVITLTDSLTKTKEINKVGGLSYIAELVNDTPTSANIWSYAQIVKKKAIRRSLQKALLDSNDLVFNHEILNEEELLDAVEKNIISVRENIDTNSDDFRPISSVMKNVMDQIDQLAESKSTITGLSTGFIDIDNMTSGLHKGQLIIVAGRPSMGKTSFAMNIAENVLMKDQKSVLLFSMEMPAEDITKRLISSVSKTPFSKLRTGDLGDDDWTGMMSGMEKINQSPFTIIDTPALTPIQIKHKSRKFKREHPDLGLIVVDYLQLMRVPHLEGNRNLEVSHISGALKALARELNIPIIALSQLNRAVDDRNDRRPMMSDLRDSGSIEQDADVIMFVYREEVYNPESTEHKGKGQIIISKQRNGSIGTINVVFRGDYCRFETSTEQVFLKRDFLAKL